MINYTPTQARIMEVLSDGERHSLEELHECLTDYRVTIPTIRVHICHIRKKLLPNRQDILSVNRGGRRFYQYVRLISTAD